MLKFFLTAFMVFATTLAHAKKIESSNTLKLSPSIIDQVIQLVNKHESGSSHKKLSIVVTDSGMTTDMSPRYSVYLGYASLAEMGNISADFLITDQTIKFLSAKRIKAGVYEVKTIEYRADDESDGFSEVTHLIDATKMFSDELKLRKNCNEAFCDKKLKTSIEVTETIR